VVKGKMDFPANYVGPRHLKGIAEPVMVWEVPSLGRLELEKRQEALMAMNMPYGTEASGLRGGRAAALLIASFVLVAGALTMLVVSANKAVHEKPPIAANAGNPAKRLKRNVETPDAAAPVQTAPAPEPKKYDEPLLDPELFKSLKNEFATYDFPSMTGTVQASQYAQTQAGQDLIDRYRALTRFMGWFNTMLDPTTRENHVVIESDPSQGNAPAFVYRVGLGEVAVETNAGTHIVKPSELSVHQIIAIAAVLASWPGSDDHLPREELIRYEKWLQEDAVRFSGAA